MFPKHTLLLVVLVGFCTSFIAESAQAACTFKLKNCRAEGRGTVKALVYNDDDFAHVVPISEALNIGREQIVDLFCARNRCDTAIHIENDPQGQNGVIYAYDICDHITVLKESIESYGLGLYTCY